MSKVNVDEIQVGDLVGFDMPNSVSVGYITDIEIKDGYKRFWGHFGNSHDPSRKEFLHEYSVDYHWKVINFEEESKVNDELKVYTGEETLQALLEGKTLKHGWNGHHYKIIGDKLLSALEGESFGEAAIVFSNLMETKFTEVATPQVGDWVKVYTYDKTYVGKLTRVVDYKMYADWGNNGVETLYLDSSAHGWEILSPEQVSEYKRELAFSKVGRKLNEFKPEDIVYVEALEKVMVVISKVNTETIILREVNYTGSGRHTAKPHQLTPISFVEDQVDLS